MIRRVGGLPDEPNNTGSPALAGQPETITGQGAAIPVPATSPSSGAQAALPGPSSPAPSSGGIAQVGGAPLSSNGAQDSQGGAGDPMSEMDLVKDRGKPMEFMQDIINDVGPERAIEIAEESANAVSHKTGKLSEDPEMAKLQGGRFADAQGITDDKAGEANRASIENMFGTMVDSAVDQKVAIGATSKKEGEKQKKRYRGAFAGMSREEISLFFFDWGATLMANSDKGFGSAMGAASQGAMGRHQGRKSAAAEAGLEDRRIGASEMQAEASMMNARTARDKASETEKPNIQWTKDGAVVIQKQEDGTWKAVPLTGAKGTQIQPGLTPGSKQGQYRDQWMFDQMVAAGYSEKEAVDFINGAPTESEVKLTVQRIWLAYDDRQVLKVPGKNIAKKKSEFTDAEYKAWLAEQVGSHAGTPGALGTTSGKDAVDEYAE